MTVNELITELQQHDGELLVTVDGYEAGHTAQFETAEIPVIKVDDIGAWWNGEYMMPFDDDPDAITVLNIGGRT